MLAVVVDDHDMGVTHVIRGDDHLNNAFRQLVIIRAMGWPEPVYAHMPLIHGPDGAKLSKRHGALGVDAYRDELGILPEALFNYLLRLGWGHGDDEIISPRAGDASGSISERSASRRRASTSRSSRTSTAIISARPTTAGSPTWSRRGSALDSAATSAPTIWLARRAMPGLKPRAKNLNELAEGAPFPVQAAVRCDMDERAAALLEGDAPDLLAPHPHALGGACRLDGRGDRAGGAGGGREARREARPGRAALRAALTGRATSPGIFDVLVLLGREESLARIADRMDGA